MRPLASRPSISQVQPCGSQLGFGPRPHPGTMTLRAQRDLVCQLALLDSQQAHTRARAIPEALFRAQALAWVARYAPPTDVVEFAREALDAALSADDPYRQVAALAWTVRALAERDHPREAEDAIDTALERAALIANPVSGVDGLFLVWQAAYPLGAPIRARVLTPLLAAACSADSWRPQRVLLSIVFMLPAEERARAEQVVASMAPGKYQRAAARRLAAGERQEPRRFFWNPAA